MNEKVILLVEDNPDDEDLALRAIKKNNIVSRVVVARDGVEALDYLHGGDASGADRSSIPTVVLLDLKIPKVDGLEVLRRLRAHPRTRLIPVVILTSSMDEKDIVQGYALGANSYVRKPVNFTDFVATVKQLGLYWLSLNEPPPQP